MSRIDVIICAHNPNLPRLRRVLSALCRQTLANSSWQCLLVDNGSQPALSTFDLGSELPANLSIISEPRLGLTYARLRGASHGGGDILVFVDDDNLLAPDYLETALRLFQDNASVGAVGGPVVPEFEQAPENWVRQFDHLLACRDLGDRLLISEPFEPNAPSFPSCAPVGAGMAIRRTALSAWLQDAASSPLSDRSGSQLSSGGDNDMIFSVLESGWRVAYFPGLRLTHLIPRERIERDYLGRLHRGIAASWIRVLHRHRANPWPPIPAWSVYPRKLRSWFVHRAWSGPAEYIRWQGACGHFEGRATIPKPKPAK